MLSSNLSKLGFRMPNKKIGVYVHWPFCARLCPYCDFNIYKNKPELAHKLTSAILKDLQKWRRRSGPRELVSIHFGGGTPSLMQPAHLATIIETVRQLWTASPKLEVAMEANPSDVSAETLADWRDVGIERLSIGAQSFDDDVLKFLGRDHDGASAYRAIELAVRHMPRVSGDLIFGWHGQTAAHWQAELDKALGLSPSHISAYQLTIEEKTAFAKAEKRGDAKAVDSDLSADLFELVGEVLGANGYDRYEVSNFARKSEDQSRHNLLYWQGGDYVGVGPGAHGRLTTGKQRIATIAALQPGAYIEKVEKAASGLIEESILSGIDSAEEYILMGLRIRQGISLKRFSELSGKFLSENAYTPLISDGLLHLTNDRLSVSDEGRLVLDAISHKLLADI